MLTDNSFGGDLEAIAEKRTSMDDLHNHNQTLEDNLVNLQ